MENNYASNQLAFETSPYLLQHAHNPVNWLPWGNEAFEKAKIEDKPIFLSIGYSTCHWCHVMAHESFEDEEVAEILNSYFIAIKVDKEERPDIDSVYMNVCLALTGSGGWPMTIMMDQEGRPFYAGTYLPKRSRYGIIGLVELLLTVKTQWETDRERLIKNAGEITAFINSTEKTGSEDILSHEQLIEKATGEFKKTFDSRNGGFGRAPKFPMGHTLVFLLEQGDEKSLAMAEKTLTQMARGGIFDQIGYGFSRYSTDAKWLAPHFEKMLYDNALLLWAYAKAFEKTGNESYRRVCEKILIYLKREMVGDQGGFYSAQDADSDGEEGKYYLFTPEEVFFVLGKERGEVFNQLYDITSQGNFEGKSIPNQLIQSDAREEMPLAMEPLYQYRRERTALHLDDKILTAWNGLMIGALCQAYLALENRQCLYLARKAIQFIKENLMENHRLFISFREGKRSNPGLLDDYAFMVFAFLQLYRVTLEEAHLRDAKALLNVAIESFFDFEAGGFFLSGKENQHLIARPKETHDGALPSGNSMMLLNLVQLLNFPGNENLQPVLNKQEDFLSRQAAPNPSAQSAFMLALLENKKPKDHLTVVLTDISQREKIAAKLKKDGYTTILNEPTEDYPLENNQITYYLCRGNTCLPPANVLPE